MYSLYYCCTYRNFHFVIDFSAFIGISTKNNLVFKSEANSLKIFIIFTVR